MMGRSGIQTGCTVRLGVDWLVVCNWVGLGWRRLKWALLID